MNKRGSYFVFISMVFAAIMIMVYAVIWASGQRAIDSTVYHFGRVWGRSILAEYDNCLKERYGVFGFYGNKLLVEEKLDYYAGYTFNSKKYILYRGAQCSLEPYSLTDVELFKKSIREAVVGLARPEPLFVENNQDTYGTRYIANRSILESLPSKNAESNIDITGLVENLKKGVSFKALADDGFINRYAFNFFKDYRNERNLGDTYFQNEIEYIISGKPDDEKARKNVYYKLIAVRNMLNLYYLYNSTEKREAALAMANIISPGPEAVITQALLLETWAYVEARNDLKILYNNKTVPLLKSDSNWALSLENAVAIEEGEEDMGYVKPAVIDGIKYESYLRIMLSIMPDDIKITRIMDLIQINLKYLYCDYFLLNDYYTGLNYSITVNGRDTEFCEVY